MHHCLVRGLSLFASRSHAGQHFALGVEAGAVRGSLVLQGHFPAEHCLPKQLTLESTIRYKELLRKATIQSILFTHLIPCDSISSLCPPFSCISIKLVNVKGAHQNQEGACVTYLIPDIVSVLLVFFKWQQQNNKP